MSSNAMSLSLLGLAVFPLLAFASSPILHPAALLHARQLDATTTTTDASQPTVSTTPFQPSSTPGATPTTSLDLGTVCTSELLNALDTMPTPPPQLEDFSRSYYVTASRTASSPYDDCAFIKDIPPPLETLVDSYVSDLSSWMFDPQFSEDSGPLIRCVEGLNGQDVNCGNEWAAYISGSGGQSGGGGVGQANDGFVAGISSLVSLSVVLVWIAFW